MRKESIYPLIFELVFKDYIGGGRNLERLFDRMLPPGIIAESWEIAGHDCEALWLNNFYNALSLQATCALIAYLYLTPLTRL